MAGGLNQLGKKVHIVGVSEEGWRSLLAGKSANVTLPDGEEILVFGGKTKDDALNALQVKLGKQFADGVRKNLSRSYF